MKKRSKKIQKTQDEIQKDKEAVQSFYDFYYDNPWIMTPSTPLQEEDESDVD